MSRDERFRECARNVAVFARAAVLSLALDSLASGCADTASRIVMASPESVPERSAQTVVLDTQGCAPTYDLDRGGADPGPPATLVLGGDAGTLPARRTLDEQFEASLPPTLLPGSYELSLRLSDGRVAPYTGRLRVLAQRVSIDAVTSPRSSAVLGESGLPLRVMLSNPGQCAVDRLTVTPTFLRDGADVSAEFVASAPGAVSIAPGGTAAVDFSVSLALSAMPGAVELDARAAGGQRSGSGPGCSGAVEAGPSAMRGSWVIVAPARASLTVTDVAAAPHNPARGAMANVQAKVRNDASVPLSIASIDLVSDPIGPVIVMPAQLNGTPLAPGGTENIHLTVSVPDDAAPGQQYVLTISAAARDTSGAVYTSAIPAPTATIVVGD